MPNGKNKDKVKVKPKVKVKSKRQRKEKIEKGKDPSKSKKIEEDEDSSKSGNSEKDEDSSKSEVRSKRQRQEKSDKDEDSLQSEKDKDSPKSEKIEKDKDSLQSVKKKQRIPEALDEVEVGLPDRLQRMFGARNVIVVGETHGDPQTGAIEATLLPALKIPVSYEGDTIKAPGGDVTPDPPAYRLLYYLEDFYELLNARMSNHNNSASRKLYDAQLNAIYNRYQHEFTNHSRTAIEGSLYYKDNPLTSYARLGELRTTLFDTLELIDGSPDDERVYSNKLIQDNARGLETLFNRLKKASGNSPDEPVMRKLRSTMMYHALKADIVRGGKRVYKVGNNHIGDIRAQFGPTAWVIDEAQYKSVLSSLSAKK